MRHCWKSSELSGVSREHVVSEESQHADRVSATTSPEACPVRARWFSTNTLKDISEGIGERKRTRRRKRRLGLWGKSRQSLPSKRAAHGQQWSSGVAVLYVVHNCLQTFSVAGRKDPAGLRHWVGREALASRQKDGRDMEGGR